MKNSLILTLTILLSLPLMAGEGNEKTYAEAHGKLDLAIQGLHSSEGKLRVLLFNNADAFPADERHAAFALDLDIAATEGRVSFESIPYGVYAIYAYHDENGNGKLDKNWAGVSKEPYGYTGREGSSRVAPLFSQSQFEFQQSGTQLQIDLVPVK